MYGFKKGAGKAERKSFANGGAVDDGANPTAAARGFGMVRGPGTGTSDSVKDAVPPGTYIMPADSTRQIGPDALGAAGFRPDALPKNPDGPPLGFGKSAGKVPVNLSNGEFRLSPEQVHAIGVQVLEGLKAATHKPAGEGEGAEEGEGEEDDGDDRASGELFFADGGLVEDERKKRQLATSPTNTYPGNQAEAVGNIYAKSNADLARGFSGATRAIPGAPMLSEGSQTRMVAGQLGDAWNENADKGNFAKAAGATLRGAAALIPAAMEDSTNATARRMQPAVEFGKGLFGIEDAKPSPAAPTAPPVAPAPASRALAAPAVASQATQTEKPAAGTPAQYSSTPAKSYMDAGPVPYTVTPVENTNGVQRINQKGQAPLFTNLAPAAAVAEMKGNPVGGFQPATMRSGEAGGAAPSGPGLGFGPSSVGGGSDVLGILQRENQIRAGMGELQDQINFNAGGGIGFRKTTNDEIVRDMLVNGNSRDRSAALGFMAGGRDAAQKGAQAAQELALRQQEMQGRQGIANEELGLKREAQGFQTATQRQIQALQEKLVAEQDPAKRNELTRQLSVMQGKVPPDRYIVAGGGQEFDAAAGGLRTLPARVFDSRTGAFVEQPAASGARPAPVVGAIMNGYRFKGGSPADKSSWEKV